MEPVAFAALAQEIQPFAANLCLSLLGESLLNPGVFQIIASAEGLGIPCALTTNGQLLDECIDDVFASGLTSLKVAIDGADRESHERYRIGSDFHRVRGALESVCAEKRRLGLDRPLITVLSLIFRHNLGQQAEIRRWSESVGADRVGFKPVWIGGGRYFGADAADLAAEWLPDDPALQHESFLQENLCRSWRVCPALHMATILWNGDMVPCGRCAVDDREAFGNVFTDGGFLAVWGSARHREVLTRLLRRESDLCDGCDTPLGGKWLG
jgi:MoaA/NifB/PqqE/SkfB family radical SAM enzyme